MFLWIFMFLNYIIFIKCDTSHFVMTDTLVNLMIIFFSENKRNIKFLVL